MNNRQLLKSASRASATLLACVAAFLMFPTQSRAQGTPFKITSFVLNKEDGNAELQWTGMDQDIVVEYTSDVTEPLWQPVPGVEWPINGTSWSGAIPLGLGKGFLRVVTTEGKGTAPIPIKNLSLVVMSWHDPQSDSFFNNCIACHGTRTDEVALDGSTPTAHGLMLDFFGQGNSRCIQCHYGEPDFSGPNFLTYSAGALREQVNYEDKGCTACHSKGSSIPLYDRY